MTAWLSSVVAWLRFWVSAAVSVGCVALLLMLLALVSLLGVVGALMQSGSDDVVQPAGQQPSPGMQEVIGVFLHAALQVPLSRHLSAVQASLSSQPGSEEHKPAQHSSSDSQPSAMLPSQLYQPLRQVQVNAQVWHWPLVQAGVQLPVVCASVQEMAPQPPQSWLEPQTDWMPQLYPRLAHVSVQLGWDVHAPKPSHLQLPPAQPVLPLQPVSVSPEGTGAWSQIPMPHNGE